MYHWNKYVPVQESVFGDTTKFDINEESIFIYNKAKYGAAIYILVVSMNIQLRDKRYPFIFELNLSGVQFLDNQGSQVGAVYVASTDVDEESNTIVYVQVKQCLFSGNTGNRGAALCIENNSLRNQSSQLLVQESVIANNYAYDDSFQHDNGAVYIQQFLMIFN